MFSLPSFLGSFSLINFSIFSRVRGYPFIFIFSPTVFASGIAIHRKKYAIIPEPPIKIDTIKSILIIAGSNPK